MKGSKGNRPNDGVAAATESGSAAPVQKPDRDTARKNEITRYNDLYKKDPSYRMGETRERDLKKVIGRLFVTGEGGSLLDVGTGRGELLAMAREAGFEPVIGTEVVKELCNDIDVRYMEAHKLDFPDNGIKHVFCIDVLEHLTPEDVEDAVRELWRVTGQTLTISASERTSDFGTGELHISARPRAQWSELFGRVTGNGNPPCSYVGGTPVWRFVKEEEPKAAEEAPVDTTLTAADVAGVV